MRVVRLALIAVLTMTVAAACGDDGGSGDAGTAEGFCATADDIYTGTEPQTEVAPEEAVDLFRRLEESAPPEIAAETVMIRQYIEVLLGVEEATAETPSQEAVGAAEAKVSDYLRNECGIVPPSTTAPTTTTSAAA